MTTLKKILTESEKVTANLLSKARKAKGVAQWAKLEPLKEKLEGKQQAHIQFTSLNPKAYGKKRTLASKEGALDFLMGYVSPRFFVAPYHLQIINPDLTDEQAKDWLKKLGHPSRVLPNTDPVTNPEGDVEQGFCHDSVGGKYPGKQISLFGEVTDQPEDSGASFEPKQVGNPVNDEGTAIGPYKGTLKPPTPVEDHPVDPAFVEAHSEAPEEQVGNPQDMLLACPFGGGSRCRAQGGSGSAFHHINSDSMRAHVEKMAEDSGSVELPKMGSFKGEPALFFEHKGNPYVAVPTRQEVHAKSGATYKWSFLLEGPLAQSNPFLAKVMNQMAPRKPVIIPHFDVAEDVVTIAHDAVPSEDSQLCTFSSDVYQLVKDYFPKPGSIIPLGIIKGEKIFAVVTERSLDFYNEEGDDSFFQAADGQYYAYFDLTGKDTPALVLLSFINLFLVHIDTTPLQQQLQNQEDAKAEAVYGEPSPGFEDVPAVPTAVPSKGLVTLDDENQQFASLCSKALKSAHWAESNHGIKGIAKPQYWAYYDLPLYTSWRVPSPMGLDFLVVNLGALSSTGSGAPKYYVYDYKGAATTTCSSSLIAVLQSILGYDLTEPELLGKAGLLGESLPPGCTVWTLLDGTTDVVPVDGAPEAPEEPEDAAEDAELVDDGPVF